MPDRNTTEPLFTGVGVALVTLFDDDGRVLTQDTAELAGGLVERGLRAVLIAGTTGEGMRLTAQERYELTVATRAILPQDVPVIVGTAHPDPLEVPKVTARVSEAGPDAIIALSPAGVPDPTDYYRSVAQAAPDLPLLAYHFPAASAPGVPLEVLESLPIVGIKDSGGDSKRLLAELEIDGLDLYVGAFSLLLAAGALGATGALLALANAEPEQCIAAFAGDPDAQRALLAADDRARVAFPGSLKEMVAERFATPTGFRA